MTDNTKSDTKKSAAPTSKDHGVLYIGMDLGTSRTAVSASNGVRESLFSVVGYPKDHVSQKLLKRDRLFGQEAIDKRLSLQFYRPLENGVLKNTDGNKSKADRDVLKAARDLINEAIRIAKPRKDELIYVVIGAPAQASIHNKEALVEAARASVDSVMLCSEPFAVAYALESLVNSLIIDIGAGTADFCVMHGRYPLEEDQRTLPIAGDHVDEQLHRLITSKYPDAKISLHMAREWKEKHSFMGEPTEKVWVVAPVQGRPTEFDATEPMRAACESLLPSVKETMLDLISRVQPEYQDRVRNNVILSGGSGLIRGFGMALQQGLEDVGGGRVRVVADPLHVGADGGLALAMDAPPSEWDKLAA